MKNNYSSSKKPKIGFVALLLFFCVLWGNDVMAQVTNTNFHWGGTVDNSWSNINNWSKTGRYVHTADYASGSTTVTIVTANLQGAAPTTVLAAGHAIVGPGIPANTTVMAFSATPATGVTITLSQATTAAGSAAIIQTYLKSTTLPVATTGNSTSGTTSTVIIDNATLGSPVITTNPAASVILMRNQFGPSSGTTLTINSGASLTVNHYAASPVSLAGGNIVNNGTLSITSTSTGASTGIVCVVPTILPSVATEYGYSGSGTLNINLSASTTANSAGVSVTSLNANTTYKMLFDGTTSISLGSTATSFALRTAGGASSSPLIIGGAGFTIGTVGSPVNGGLLSLGGQSSVTVNSGTTLTLNSASTNITRAITSFSTSGVATNFTNNGTINIQGASTNSGLFFSVGTGASANVVPFNISNGGTLNVNLSCSGIATAALATGNGGGAGATGTAVHINNSGTLTLKNTSTATGTGFAILGSDTGEAPAVIITNSGTLNIEGSVATYGLKTSIINNGILNTNSELRNFSTITNANGASINFVRTVATATSKLVTFNVVSPATTSALAGATFSLGGNTYTVIFQKFAAAFGNTLYTSVISSADTSALAQSGTLTYLAGTASGNIAYGPTAAVVGPPAVEALAGFSATMVNGALSSSTTNTGTINTDTASNLNIISGVTAASTGTIAPGGTSGKGIADFSNASTLAINSKLKLQVSGNATAGVDFDQITNTATGGGFDISGATLDVSDIYTPVAPTSIDILSTNATGTLTGSFSSVVGLPLGWAVVYTNGTAGKVQLVYGTTTWTGATNTDWSVASNWTSGLPDAAKDVTIAAAANQPIIASNVSVKSLTLNASTSLTVTSGFNLTVTGAVANSGTMTIANNANLIQGGTTNTNTGNIIVNRNGNALKLGDYTIWSSPVANQNLLAFSPATITTRFYDYNETTNFYNVVASPATAPFASGSGYLIRMPNNGTVNYEAGTETSTYLGIFSGVPNNGTINKVITYNGTSFGYNMVGNPYPSTIDAQAFITANAANIESSLYFWRKTNGAAGSSYAVYNPLGGTVATPSSDVPNGTIQVGQGFFVKAKSASNLSFTNEMRIATNTNQFFKTKQTTKDRLWLNLTNTTGAFSQALIGYTADATLGIDIFDGKYINDSPIALTSKIYTEEYSIQGRPAFDASDIVALNFKTDLAGDYTIALDHFDGVFSAGQDIYLLDSKTGVETNLKTGSYSFTTATGADNTRFSLKYQKTLKVNVLSFNENNVRVYKNNGTLYVNTGSARINTVEVYDVQGRLLASQKNVKATTAALNNLKAINQVLIVKISSDDNSVVSKKVLN